MSYSSTVLGDSPLLYWRLDEASGTVAADATGNGRPGTYTATGITYSSTGLVTGDSDTAVTLNGSTGFISRANSGVFDTTSLSVEVSFKASSFAANNTLACVRGASTRWDLVIQNNNVIGINNGTVFDPLSFTFATGTAYHVVATYDGTSWKIWVNGAVVGTITRALGSATTQPFTVGANSSPSEFFTGVIDDVSLYNTALTQTQVRTHYGAWLNYPVTDGYFKAVFADIPTVYWRLGETSGTVAADFSGNAHPGTYQAGVTLGTAGLVGADHAITTVASNTSYVDSTSVSLPAIGSIECLFKISGATNGAVMSYGWNTGFTVGFGSGTQDSSGTEVVGELVGTAWVPTGTNASTGVRHHLVMTFDGSVATIYLDGVSIGTNTNGNAAPDAHISVGGNNRGTFRYVASIIDEAAWYSTALSSATVVAHHNAFVADPPGNNATAAWVFGASGTLTVKHYGGSAAWAFASSASALTIHHVWQLSATTHFGVDMAGSRTTSVTDLVNYGLDETSGLIPIDSVAARNGSYVGGVVLQLPEASSTDGWTYKDGYSIGLNGTSAYVDISPAMPIFTGLTTATAHSYFKVAAAPAGATTVLEVADTAHTTGTSMTFTTFMSTKAYPNRPFSTDNGEPVTSAELEGYKNANVTVDVTTGQLVLTATHTSMTTYLGNTKTYTSGYVQTGGNLATSLAAQFQFLYGHCEIIFKVHFLGGPTGINGLWPALWFISRNGNNFPWPPELDMMEMFGVNTYSAFVHLSDIVGNNNPLFNNGYSTPLDPTSAFHTAAMDWQPDRVEFFLDGTSIGKYVGNDIPNMPLYLNLNLAVGGSGVTTPNPTDFASGGAEMRIARILVQQ